MLSKLIDEITAAELAAQQTLNAANAQAETQALALRAELEKRRSDFLQALQDAQAKTLADAEREAEAAYNTIISNAQEKAEQIKKSAEKNQSKAVDYIIKNI